MDQLDLARIRFATNSIYHFLFVPVTMGLAILVAVLHTRWQRSGNPEFRRLTRFFGTLMLISISVGVVTGLVQEFQFGMDWSAYPGSVAVRLERPAETRSPVHRLDGSGRSFPLGRFHHRREFLDAESARLHPQSGYRTSRTEFGRRGVQQSADRGRRCGARPDRSRTIDVR